MQVQVDQTASAGPFAEWAAAVAQKTRHHQTDQARMTEQRRVRREAVLCTSTAFAGAASGSLFQYPFETNQWRAEADLSSS